MHAGQSALAEGAKAASSKNAPAKNSSKRHGKLRTERILNFRMVSPKTQNHAVFSNSRCDGKTFLEFFLAANKSRNSLRAGCLQRSPWMAVNGAEPPSARQQLHKVCARRLHISASPTEHIVNEITQMPFGLPQIV